MPAFTTAGSSRHSFLRRVARLVLILVALLCLVTSTSNRAVPQARIARAANADNNFESNPTHGPPGATVSIFAYSFSVGFIADPATIVFDDRNNTVLATTTMVACGNNGREAGFGAPCSGQELDLTIPSDAAPGDHTLIMRITGESRASTPFTVDQPPTATDTATATLTDTDTATATNTATATATGTSTSTRTPTATATNSAIGAPSATPSSTATGVQVAPNTGTPTPTSSLTPITVPRAATATATTTPSPNIPPAKIPTATATQTAVPQPPVLTHSITVGQLQAVVGGCVAAPRAPGVLDAGALSVQQGHQAAAFQGGQGITLHAASLPANALVDLVVNAPRAAVSGVVSTTIDYSPPVIQARTDARGTLATSLVLPSDLAAGNGQIQAFLHTAARGSAHPTLLTTWSFTGAPADPVVQVAVRDAAGQPIRGAIVTYLPKGALSATGISLAQACGRTSDAAGGAVFSRVPPGSGQVVVSSGGKFVGSSVPITAPGATIYTTVRANLECAHIFSPVEALYDEESGGNGATSGDGPFGTFISGVRTMDSFSAQLTEKVALDTAVTLSFRDGHGNTALSAKGFIAQGLFGPIALGTRALGSRGLGSHTDRIGYAPSTASGPLAASAYSLNIGTSPYLLTGSSSSSSALINRSRTVVFPPVDLGTLGPGDWSAVVTLGSDTHCPQLYSLKMINNPWRAPIGTIHPVYDRVDHAYYASDQLPNSGLAAALLHFQQPHIQIGWNAFDVAGIVTVPGFHIPFPELASSDLGIDLDERLFTTGHWYGSLTAHAKVKMLGVSLLDRQMPTYPGNGNNITRDEVTLFDYPAINNQALAGVPLVDYPVGFPGIASANFRISFNMHGSLDMRLGVAAVLDRVIFTFDPAISAGLEASAHVDFAGQSAGASLNGSVTIQAPVTVSVPGTISADLVVRFSVKGHAYARFCFIKCGGPSTDFTLFSICLLGNCAAAPQLAAVGHPAHAGGSLRAGHQANLITPMSPPTAADGARPASMPKRSPLGRMRARPQPAVYPAQPSIAISPSGQKAALWVGSTGGQVRLFAAMGNGQPRTIAISGAQIATPRVAWIGADRAVAVWIGNTASTAQIAALAGASARNGYQALVLALSDQELYTATWDGTTWSAPRRLTRDTFADSEPALAGDPVRHTATLLWAHALKNDTFQDVIRATALRVSTYAHGLWTAARPVQGTGAGGVHAPAVAVDAHGRVALAWMAGAGSSAVAMIAVDGQRSGQPQAVPGIPQGTAHLSLAFDGDDHPVLAADGAPLVAARQGAAGRWTVWILGAGTGSQLFAERDGSLALATLPGTGDPLEALGIPTLRILPRGGTFGAPLPVPGTTNDAIAIVAAADPSTGIVKALVQNATVSKHPTDPAAQIVQLAIAAGGRLALVPDSLRLDPPQPQPGTHALLLVQVRNTGFATLPPGGLVVLQLGPSGATLRLRTAATLAPGTTTTLKASVTVPQVALLVNARADRQVLSATLALPPMPVSLGSTPRASQGGLQLNWSPPADPAIVSYRVYRGVGVDGPLSLVGIATDKLWLDMLRRPGTTYRYRVTAVDSYGRESALSAPLTPSPS